MAPLFKKGLFYSRDDVWELYHPEKGQRPGGGIWDTGYVKEGNELIAFLNIGVPGRTGHDFKNDFDEETGFITWFGKPGTHPSQPLMKALINGDLRLHFFSRWDDKVTVFRYLGLGELVKFEDDVELEDGRKVIKFVYSVESLNELIGDGGGDYLQATSTFALEKHLEDFLVENWSSTELGQRYDIYEEAGEIVGQQYPTDTGPIDILATSKDKKEFLVIELKKGRPTDSVVGQISRYMGFVSGEKARNGESVKGIIVGLEDDLKLQRALMVTPNIEFYSYEVNFRLIKSETKK